MRNPFLALVLAIAIPRLVWAGCETILATDSTKVAKTGDTMTGTLTMSNSPISLSGTLGYVSAASSITTTGGLFGVGTAITALNASEVTSGTLPNARLDSSSVTLAGNAFNGASQLLRADSSGLLPNADLDSSSVTLLGPNISLASGGEVTGTLPAANGGTGATTLTSNGVLYGNGTSAIQALPAMADLGIVVGNTSAAPSTATLTAGTGITIAKSATGVTITNSAVGAGSGWVQKETQSITAATTFSFSTTLTPGNFYEVVGSFRQATAATNVYVTFNDVESGTAYKSATQRWNDAAASALAGSTGGSRGICTSGVQVQAGEHALFTFRFRTDPSDSTIVHWLCDVSGNGPAGASNLVRHSAAGSFDGAANITSVQIDLTDGGTSTGKAVLLEAAP